VRRISPSPRSRAQFGEPAHLCRRQFADWKNDADPVQARLLLGMDADMPGAVE